MPLWGALISFRLLHLNVSGIHAIKSALVSQLISTFWVKQIVGYSYCKLWCLFLCLVQSLSLVCTTEVQMLCAQVRLVVSCGFWCLGNGHVTTYFLCASPYFSLASPKRQWKQPSDMPFSPCYLLGHQLYWKMYCLLVNCNLFDQFNGWKSFENF